MAREKVFKFKQFAVVNDRSAMKVGTDGVLLGAWCPVEGARRVLDVGTGCGVIALMIAQRNHQAMIDAIDIDHDAIEEATLNFTASPWSDRLTAIREDFNNFINNVRYDLIISNPPYFSNGFLPNDDARVTARHSVTLTYRQLIEGATRRLNYQGNFAFISPTEAKGEIINAAAYFSLPVRQIIHVIPVEGAKSRRILWLLTRRHIPFCENYLTITHKDGSFTIEYIALTNAFYQKM